MRSAEEVFGDLPPEEYRKLLAKYFGYLEVPPTIDEFIEDPYWLGEVLDRGKSLYPFWRQKLRQVFPNPFYSPYVEIVATGAIGIGKTTLAKVGASYDLAKLLLLENPHATYNLLKTTAIEYLIINATLNLAKSVIYDELLAWYFLSPFFASQIAQSDGKTLFPKRIHLSQGSRASHALGRAIFGAILDEMNFQDKVANQAFENYTQVLRRMQSRFGSGGKLPGHLWLLSSKRRPDDPLQVHIERSRGSPGTIVFDAAIWEVKAEQLRLSGKYFLVYAGDSHRDPFIIGEEADYKSILYYGLDESRIVKVPIEFRKDFELNLYEALRDLAGVSVQSAYQFIGSVEALERSMMLENPVAREIIELDFHDPEDSLLRYFEPHMQRLVHPIAPNAPRYLHIDLALTKDRVGIAASAFLGWAEILRKDPISGQQQVLRQPNTLTDFVIWIQAKPGQEIPLFKIKEFVIDLLRLKYPLALVSTDGFQSALLRQELTMSGIATQLVSVDRTPDPYLNLKRAIMESRHMLPKSPKLKEELLQLVDTGKKIDHPPHGSKDGADAVAGSLWTLYQDMDRGSNFFHQLKDLNPWELELRISEQPLVIDVEPIPEALPGALPEGELF